MYAERETFGPANLSIVATRSSDRVSDVLAFILPLYYHSRIRQPGTGLPVGQRYCGIGGCGATAAFPPSSHCHGRVHCASHSARTLRPPDQSAVSTAARAAARQEVLMR